MATNYLPYWPRTASMDWCEENYAKSPYIAEFYNTLSSCAIALFGMFGLYHLLTTHRRFTRQLSEKTEAIAQHRFALYWAYSMITVVGLGSVAFHGTLTWQGQALDEVPMLYTTVAFLYALLSVKGKPSKLVTTLLLVYCVLVTGVYFIAGFAFFICFYSSCVAGLIILTLRFCIDARCHSRAKKIAAIATFLYAFGCFVFWIPETVMCGNRLHDKHQYAFQWVNAHALFHITSAFGCYSWAVFVTFAQLDFSTSKRWEKEGSEYAGVVASEGVEPATRCRGNALTLGFPLPYVIVVPSEQKKGE